MRIQRIGVAAAVVLGLWGCAIDDAVTAAEATQGAALRGDLAPPDDCHGARCRMRGIDPWSAEQMALRGAPEAERIVGTNDLTNPLCHSLASGVEALADSVGRFVRGDDPTKICSGVLATHDNKVIVSTECMSGTAALGSITFDAYPSGAGCAPVGAPLGGDTYPVIAEQVKVDTIYGFQIVQLGLNASGQTAFSNHFSARFNDPVNWPKSVQANFTDELVYAGTQRTYTLVDDACNVKTTFAPVGTTDCDSDVALPSQAFERGLGGLLAFDLNWCVAGAGGGCNPSTGPQSPGARPGRVFAFHYRPSTTSPNNRAVPLHALTDDTPTSPPGDPSSVSDAGQLHALKKTTARLFT